MYNSPPLHAVGLGNIRLLLVIVITLIAHISCQGERRVAPFFYEPIEPSQTIPVIHINTKDGSPINSKTEYIPATFYINDPAGQMNVGYANSPLGMKIRGRGNSSWKSDKKPYKVKLDAKLPLLGMPESRHWALLKFWAPTMAGLKLGELIGMSWTPSTKPIEVVLNGDYIGLYLLTESVRINKHRVNIYEQPENNIDENTIPGGWLVEIDNYREPNQITFRENNQWSISLTHHSPKRLSTMQLQWLKDEFKSINDDIYTANKASSRWEERIDIEAMARFFIIQEILDNPDGFHGSFYLHKDLGEGQKWIAGPIWDLTCMCRPKTDYTYRMKAPYSFASHWINELLKDEDFCKAVRDAWEAFYPSISNDWMLYLERCFAPYEAAHKQDARRWTYKNYVSLSNHAAVLRTALQRNLEWFNNHLPKRPASIKPITSSNNHYVVYSIRGEIIRTTNSYEKAIKDLPKGFYIINNKKVYISY